jgi:hypothetical protein
MTPEQEVLKNRLRKKLAFRVVNEHYEHLCSGTGETPENKKYTRQAQQELYEVLLGYNTTKLMTCNPVPEHHIRHLLWCLDLVQNEVLRLVTCELQDEEMEIREGKRPKLTKPFTLGYLADKCLVAMNATKELDALCQTAPKPPIRRPVL